MDSTIIDEEELLAKHRKERKDLQVEVQKLKKGVSKGDKKKKKEATDEIAKMEASLNAKQEEEMAAFKSLNEGKVDTEVDSSSILEAADDVENEATENEPSQRKSKAQKRRDKKQEKGKEREQRIEKQAVENRKGPRQQEIIKVATMLKEIGLALHEIPADGNCMYNAIGHQLALRDVEASCTELREKTANFMRDHPDDFLPFTTHPDTGDTMTIDEFSAYCDKTAKSPVWGGQIELRALSEALDTPIKVLQADVQPLLIGETKDGPPLTVVYQRHAYRLGEHYNSVLPKDYSDNEENQDGLEDGVD